VDTVRKRVLVFVVVDAAVAVFIILYLLSFFPLSLAEENDKKAHPQFPGFCMPVSPKINGCLIFYTL
jgi:hypothetical protein